MPLRSDIKKIMIIGSGPIVVAGYLPMSSRLVLVGLGDQRFDPVVKIIALCAEERRGGAALRCCMGGEVALPVEARKYPLEFLGFP